MEKLWQRQLCANVCSSIRERVQRNQIIQITNACTLLAWSVLYTYRDAKAPGLTCHRPSSWSVLERACRTVHVYSDFVLRHVVFVPGLFYLALVTWSYGHQGYATAVRAAYSGNREIVLDDHINCYNYNIEWMPLITLESTSAIPNRYFSFRRRC